MKEERSLTPSERALVRGMFGAALDPEPVRIRNWRWWPLQPRRVIMAPMGHLHAPSGRDAWPACFAGESVRMQAFFLHEMTHVWQAQTHGRWYLPLMRHPFCRYDYTVVPGRPFERYGLEQQAQIVTHVHLLRHGIEVPGKPPLPVLEAILPFGVSSIP